MGRPLRTDQRGGWFHVVNRGVDRCDIFGSDANRVEFGRLLGVAHDRFGVVVHAYCLMTNHYHLVVECPDGKLSEAMHLVGSVYVRHANERLGRDGPLFTDRFYAKPVVDEPYLRRLVRYVHRNPLAFLAEETLASYRWSSLRTYLGRRRPPAWLQTDAVVALFGGAEAFETSMFEQHHVTDHLGDHVGPETYLAAVDLMVDEYLGGATRQRAGRTVALLLLEHLDAAAAAALTAALGSASPGAISSARSRARRRAETEPRLLAAADAVIDFLS
jgi:REP element-mobilizing transposase RayT